MARNSNELKALADEIAACRSCERLVAWREAAPSGPRHVGDPNRYWARPVPGFGDAAARLLIVGLAPAAHGANRTGRMFTGDRSGDFLFAALHRAGFSSQATSSALGDGLELRDAFVTSAVRCAPPDNRPTREERRSCSDFLEREMGALSRLSVVLALGAFAFEALLDGSALEPLEHGPRPRFIHGGELPVRSKGRELLVLSSYHPSQRNVFTGVLTAEMFDSVLTRASKALEVASA